MSPHNNDNNIRQPNVLKLIAIGLVAIYSLSYLPSSADLKRWTTIEDGIPKRSSAVSSRSETMTTATKIKTQKSTQTTKIKEHQTSKRPSTKNRPETKNKWEQQQVGGTGRAVEFARQHRLVQRMKGFPRSKFDIIESSVCLNGTANRETARTSNEPFRALNNDASSGIERSLHQRLPFAILLGVQKGGTTALYDYLDAHPDIAKCRKEIYFLDERIDQLMLQASVDSSSYGTEHTGGIPRRKVQNMYAQVMAKSIKSRHDIGKLLLDMTPNYLFESDRLPARIMCIVPWAKIFVLLRNPLERALSQYEMKLRLKGNKNKTTNQNGYPIPTFHEYVQADIEALKETGVLQDWSKVDFNEFSGSEEEFEAWRTYINSGLNAPVGMGLYSLQLKHFLDEFDRQGKPRSDFLAIRSEDLKASPDETYGKVLDFLGLPRISLKKYPSANAARQWKQEMTTETRDLLRTVFDPYNHQLAEMLGSEWDGVWN